MDLIFESKSKEDYLLRSEIIDFEDEAITRLAQKLKASVLSEEDLARKTYEYVRDKIGHSADINGHIVTCNASDVLKVREGICYAKSHLLAALLRKNGMPTGFCYQLLRLDEDNSPLILHGLNAVYISEVQRWVRLDARGNKEGVDAQFRIDKEQLAFPIRQEVGEKDYPYVFASPDPNVIEVLTKSKTVDELWDNLPNCLERNL